MIAQAKTTLHRLLVTIGLALVTIVVLLSWSAAQGGSVQALSHEPEASKSEVWHDFGIAWASMTPTTTTVTSAGKVWEIETQNVTITFRLNSLASSSSAVFTFTPQSQSVLSSPLTSSTYFFTLEGTYQNTGGIVSLNDYDIALHYQESELNGAQESTLNFYQYDANRDRDKWEAQPGTVDTVNNTIECETNKTGLFGIAGYRYQTFLPLVLRRHS